MNVEVSVIGIPTGNRSSDGLSVAQETDRRWVVPLPMGTTVSGLIKLLALPYAEIQLVLVNGRHADRRTVLRDGDAVALTGLVSDD